MPELVCKHIFFLMEKYRKNEIYLDNNYKEIEKGHYNKFVAIDNEQIIGANNRIEKLVDDLDQNNKNAPTVLIKFIS